MLQGKNLGYVILMQAWILMLDKLSCPKALVFTALAFVACPRIKILMRALTVYVKNRVNRKI